MSDIITAQRYATALSRVIEDDSALDKSLQELQAFSDAFTTNLELRRVLMNPSITAKHRQAVFDQVVSLDESDTPSKRTIQVLYQRGRLALIAKVAEEFGRMVDTRLNRVIGTLTTARSLSSDEETQIQKSISHYSGKHIHITTHINPDILGGIVVRIGDTIIDGSLRTRLAQLKQALLAEENGPYENSGH